MSSHDESRTPGASPEASGDRVVAFIDGQNAYRGARRAFGWEARPGHYGNFRPISLGRFGAAGRTLSQVRIYTGVPTSERDRRGNAITQRRIAAWIADAPSLVEVFPRPLKYPPRQGQGEVREKGVDVELAIDLLGLAIDDTYDVAVIASTDTDLLPAIEAVLRRFPAKRIETLGYVAEPGNEDQTAAALDVASAQIVRRRIDVHEFGRMADRRNYVADRSRPAAVVGQRRWSRIHRRLQR